MCDLFGRGRGTDGGRTDHTMIRVKDADRSIAFYRDQLGMKLVHEMKVVRKSKKERERERGLCDDKKGPELSVGSGKIYTVFHGI